MYLSLASALYMYIYIYKLAAPKILFFLPAFVTRLLTPWSRKSGFGLILGCISGLDAGPFEKTFFWRFRPPKNGGKIFTVCFGPASQSIGRGRISREGALDLRESRERRDKIQKTPKFWIRNSSFQWGIFIFLAAGKLTFFGGGYNFKTG